MASKHIKSYRSKLRSIIEKNPVSKHRTKLLRELAVEIGAADTSEFGADAASENRIFINNIQLALQTATMIDMCRTASRNFWIAIVAAIIAGLSAVAAWVAVLSSR
ncbi:MAG: hypothetical protein FVQ80_12530 [Planctomycetes bacterium]|nr:hypothetical protein [Planctomycetota bacterium]